MLAHLSESSAIFHDIDADSPPTFDVILLKDISFAETLIYSWVNHWIQALQVHNCYVYL